MNEETKTTATTTANLLGSEWLEHDGKRVTYKGKTYRILANLYQVRYPVAGQWIVRADAELVGGKVTAEDLKFPFTELVRTYDEEFGPALLARLNKRAVALVS